MRLAVNDARRASRPSGHGPIRASGGGAGPPQAAAPSRGSPDEKGPASRRGANWWRMREGIRSVGRPHPGAATREREAARPEKRDKRFPLFFNDNPIRRWLLPPGRLTRPFVTRGQVVADVGCGPGFHALELARLVGPEGKVHAVDSDEEAIRALRRKAGERGLLQLEAHAASATDLRFVQDASIDFVLAHGLFCSMAPQHHALAVNEVVRILKPRGVAYLSVARGPWSYVGGPEWKRILERFTVERRGEGFPWLAHRWAVVRPRQPSAPVSAGGLPSHLA